MAETTVATPVSPADAVVACTDCGAQQRLVASGPEANAYCLRCGRSLERAAGRSAGAAFACAAAALVLFVPGNVLPAMRSNLLAASLEGRVVDGAITFWQGGWPLLALIVVAFVVVAPVARAAALVAVLGSLGLGRHPTWLGPLFRHAEALRLWSMPPVYLIAGLVTYSRIAAQLDVEVLPGGWTFAAATLLLLIADLSVDRRAVWQAIEPDQVTRPAGDTFGCDACEMVVPADLEGRRCPRCARRLSRRKPHSIQRTAAVTLGALLLYPAALFLPMTVTAQPGGVFERNIVDGVTELVSRGFWYFGVFVFTASVAIPAGKLVALSWLMFRAWRPRRKRAVLRTKLHRFIDEINRWSFVDPFIVAVTVPIMTYPGIVNVRPGPGALPFAAVVVLTMLGSRFFDTRLMWDAREVTSDG